MKTCSISVRSVLTCSMVSFMWPCGAAENRDSQLTTPQSKPAGLVAADGLRPEETPIARLTIAMQERDWYLRHKQLAALGEELGRTQPEVGWNMVINEFEFLPDRQAFKMPLLRIWGRQKPLDALAACTAIPLGERRAKAISGALEGWASVAPSQAADWVKKNLSGIYLRMAAAQVASTWARTEPKEAAEWALATVDEKSKVFLLNQVLEVWVLSYGRDAAQWASELNDPRLRDLAMSKAIFDWTDHMPQTAAEYLLTNPDYRWMMPRVVARWGKYDPDAANKWVSNLKDEELAQECRAELVQEWAFDDAPKALEWARTNLDMHHLIVQRPDVLSQWPEYDIQNAIAWAGKLELAEDRAAALRQLFENWVARDMESFNAWLQAQKPGLGKDIGLELLADALINLTPSAALDAALSIQEPQRQKACLQKHFQDWKAHQPEAAAAWIQKHPEAAKSLKQ